MSDSRNCKPVFEMSDLEMAKIHMKEQIRNLYTNLENLIEVEEDVGFDPHRNIIENFSKKNKLVCNICDRTFITRQALDTHTTVNHTRHTTVSDLVTCTVCERLFQDWQSRDHHMVTEHKDSPESEIYNLDNVLCCTMCRKHFVDEDDWNFHFKKAHSAFTVQSFWMKTYCDRKGKDIIDDPRAKLLCLLCDVPFPFNPNVFNFGRGHGATEAHKKALKKYVLEKNRLPVKFLKVVDVEVDIPGLYHPHELQNSCCCRIFGCEYCKMHQSMKKKFDNGVMVLCTLCSKNFEWKDLNAGLEHVRSPEHYRKLCYHVTQTSCEVEIMCLFKNSGQSIPTIGSR